MNAPALYHGLFRWEAGRDGHARVLRALSVPSSIPCPTSGRQLRIATVDADTEAICPACSHRGHGGFVSFEGDLRMAYACPQCRQLVWVRGA